MEKNKKIEEIKNSMKTSSDFALSQMKDLVMEDIPEDYREQFLVVPIKGSCSLVESIAQQILDDVKEKAYFMESDFFIFCTGADLYAINTGSELFKIFMKDPTLESRKVTVTLK